MQKFEDAGLSDYVSSPKSNISCSDASIQYKVFLSFRSILSYFAHYLKIHCRYIQLNCITTYPGHFIIVTCMKMFLRCSQIGVVITVSNDIQQMFADLAKSALYQPKNRKCWGPFVSFVSRLVNGTPLNSLFCS